MSETVPKPDTDVIIGVDTHKLTHTAVAVSALGVRLGGLTIPASSRGYQALQAWARSLGAIRSIGVEGTGSYGAGLARFLSEHGYPVLEVNRPSRQLRHQKGKDDTLDAESAARSVLAGQAKALPKSGTSTVEMIRHLKVARDTAVKARSQAMLTIQAIIVSAPSALREQFDRMVGKMTLLRSLAAPRPGPLTSTTASAKTSLRALARRWFALDAEVKDQDAHLAQLSRAADPAARARPAPGARHGRGHRRRNAHPRWRQPRAHSFRGGPGQALRCLPDPSLQRQDHPVPAQPWRQPTG
nr:transposase [Pseudomonas sp.]